MTLGKIHKSCNTLPLAKFIDILVDGNLKHLIIYGYLTEAKLQATWDAIFQEYMDLTKNETHTHLFNTIKEYTALRNKIVIAETLLQGIVFNRNAELIKALKHVGISYRFTEQSLEKDFKKAVAKIKTWIFRAEKLYKELKDQPDTGKGVRKSDFGDLLAELNAFQGYHMSPDKITVSEYVAVLNRYKKHVEDGKRRKNNRVNR